MKKIVMIWDYRMRWLPSGRPLDYRAGGHPYPFGRETFLNDMYLCIDFLARHGYDGIIVWGLFRESHGGEKAVKQICDYARKRGIGIFATLGVACYGGAYWEGNHRFNLDDFLAKNSTLAAVNPAGNPILKGRSGYDWSMACPSHPEVIEWTAAAVEWLVRNFDIAGFEFQCGDYGVCACPRCRARTGDNRHAKFSYQDVVDILRIPLAAGYRYRPDLLYTANVYMAVREGRNLAGNILRTGLPPYVYATWWCHTSPVCMHPEPAWPALNCDLVRYLAEDGRRLETLESFELPAKRNIGQMVVNTTAYYADKYIFLDNLSKMARLAHKIKLDGIMIYGELSDFSHIVNYLALEAFLDNPKLPLLDFWRSAEPQLIEYEKSLLC